MQHHNIFGNDKQFETVVNSHEKTDSQNATILDGQFSEQIKIFYTLKFTMTSWTNVLHYFNSDKMDHKLYGIIGLKHLFTKKNAQIGQFTTFLQTSIIKELLKSIKQNKQSHPQFLYELVLVLKTMILTNWEKFNPLIKNESNCIAILGLLKTDYTAIIENIMNLINIIVCKSPSCFKIMLKNKIVQVILPVTKQNIQNPHISENGLQLLAHLVRNQKYINQNILNQVLIFICQSLVNANFRFNTTKHCLQRLSKYRKLYKLLNQQISQKLLERSFNLIITNFVQFQIQMGEKLTQYSKNKIKQNKNYHGQQLIQFLFQFNLKLTLHILPLLTR